MIDLLKILSAYPGAAGFVVTIAVKIDAELLAKALEAGTLAYQEPG
jgi:hypothetical protein